MDLAQIVYLNSTFKDEQNGTRIRFTATSKIKLLLIKEKS